MSRQTIAVITPAHPNRVTNGKLDRAMRSVYAQTLLPDATHVAIDVDAEGAAPTRHRALMSARTDWVAFLDSDDEFMPKHLFWLLRHAQDTGADFVYSWFKLRQEFADGTSKVWETDPIFPPGHYLNDFDGSSEETVIETTITTLVRTELAQSVGFAALPGRVEAGHNTGEDRSFTLGCWRAGAEISHLRRRSWYWSHWQQPDGRRGNTSGFPWAGDGGHAKPADARA